MAAKMIAVKDIVPGCVLADTVLSVKGKVLLGKDVELTPRHITLLNTWDVQNVFIRIPEEQPAVVEAAPEPTQNIVQKANSKDYLQFVQEFDSLVTNVAQSFDFIQKSNIIPMTPLKDAAGKIHTTITKNGLAVINYLLISDYKLANFVSRHSVMVAFFAGNIARQLKWSEEDIRGVALAGLLHDIGNLAAGKLNDTRAYLAEAAVLLKKAGGISSEVILGIIQHRECMDGSGFPTAINGFKIHPYAKVIAVADIFHVQAYTGEYANPFPVLEMLSHEMLGKLDTAVCHTFISQIRDSLLNNKIQLHDGREAEVIFFHPNGSCLPIVRTADGQIVDLSQRGSGAISRIVSPS